VDTEEVEDPFDPEIQEPEDDAPENDEEVDGTEQANDNGAGKKEEKEESRA
jgi:hypothetical protein